MNKPGIPSPQVMACGALSLAGLSDIVLLDQRMGQNTQTLSRSTCFHSWKRTPTWYSCRMGHLPIDHLPQPHFTRSAPKESRTMSPTVSTTYRTLRSSSYVFLPHQANNAQNTTKPQSKSMSSFQIHLTASNLQKRTQNHTQNHEKSRSWARSGTNVSFSSCRCPPKSGRKVRCRRYFDITYWSEPVGPP